MKDVHYSIISVQPLLSQELIPEIHRPFLIPCSGLEDGAGESRSQKQTSDRPGEEIVGYVDFVFQWVQHLDDGPGVRLGGEIDGTQVHRLAIPFVARGVGDEPPPPPQ